ncbi:MAG: hypothetical protein JSR56_01600 [Proteobacteria bacterium]|nr:hypothetical protein [Pseudomonadota bacterium]
MKAAPAIGFNCRVSPTLVAVTLAVAVLAMVAVWSIRGPAWLHAILFVLIVVYAGAAARNLARPPVKALLWRAEGGVELQLRDSALEDGGNVVGAVQGARVMGPLIVLTLRWPRRGRATLWLLPDNLDADTRRRLRMRLGATGTRLASGNADSG